jgi:hypothetical protein
MQEQSTMMSTVSALGIYNSYISALIKENEKAEQLKDIAEICKSNFKKLSLVKKFSEIDEDILNYEIANIDDCSANFFSGILAFETTRLRFKEEITKCTKTSPNQNLGLYY